MAVSSPRFSWNLRIQSASENSPPMKKGETGEAVRMLQQALVDLHYPMPVSFRKHGSPDGIYGSETAQTVWNFQSREKLSKDGIAGRQTWGRLDTMLPNAAPPLPPLPVADSYVVPGLKSVIAQPSSMACWATVYCMMRSWKDQMSHQIRHSVELVTSSVPPANRYVTAYDNNTGLPSTWFGDFINDADMEVEPMANYTVGAWEAKLRHYGLLWVGALAGVAANSGLHSRIVEGIRGDHSYGNTWMKIIDPAGGVQYEEPFALFLHKYETAITTVSGDYFQIRHF